MQHSAWRARLLTLCRRITNRVGKPVSAKWLPSALRNEKTRFCCPFLRVFGAVALGMKLVDALALVNETRKNVPQPFSMEFYTLNRNQGTGGELQKAENVIGAASNHDAMQNGTITIKPAFGKSHPITVHIRLIKTINGQKVFW